MNIQLAHKEIFIIVTKWQYRRACLEKYTFVFFCDNLNY